MERLFSRVWRRRSDLCLCVSESYLAALAHVVFFLFLHTRLLLVAGDLVCFPSKPSDDIHMTPVGESENSKHFGNNEFLQRNSISGLFRIDETPIRSFICHFFDMDSIKSHNSSYFWQRLKRWIHCDLALHENTSLTQIPDHVLNYGPYHQMYQNSYRWFTCGTWILVIISIVMNLTTFRFADLRYILITFFVCPFSVVILESLYQSIYFFRVVGFWKHIIVMLNSLCES